MFADMLAKVRRIPKGRVSTYGEVAAASGHPGAARQVVWALRAATDVPWHRVVGAGGRIRLTGESGFEQRLRLRSEGVAIAGDKIDLGRYLHAFILSNRDYKERRVKPTLPEKPPSDRPAHRRRTG